MELTVKRMSRWLGTALVGAGMAAMVGSTASATTLLGKDFKISTDVGVETSPDVALATKNTTEGFFSVWNEQTPSTVGNVVYGQLTSQNGKLIGSEVAIAPLANGVGDTRPRLGYSPKANTFMVVWEDDRNAATTGEEVFGQLITSSGALSGANFPIGTAIADQQRPGVAYNSINDEYLVVWADDRNQSTTGFDIYGQIVKSNGTLVGSNFAITTAKNVQDMSRVAFDPIKGQYLVVWSDDRNESTTGFDIYAQKVGLSGTLAGAPIVVSNAPYDQFRPDITWDGNDDEFMVVWVDCRNVGYPACQSGDKTNGDIYGQVIASGGTLTGSNFPIATSTDSEYRPAVSFSATSDLFQVIYSDQSNTINTGASEIWGVEVMPDGALVGSNMPVTPTGSTSIQERASIAWNPNNNDWLVDFVNQASGSAPQFVWGQFLTP
jgi:hypothetical protein